MLLLCSLSTSFPFYYFLFHFYFYFVSYNKNQNLPHQTIHNNITLHNTITHHNITYCTLLITHSSLYLHITTKQNKTQHNTTQHNTPCYIATYHHHKSHISVQKEYLIVEQLPTVSTIRLLYVMYNYRKKFSQWRPE